MQIIIAAQIYFQIIYEQLTSHLNLKLIICLCIPHVLSYVIQKLRILEMLSFSPMMNFATSISAYVDINMYFELLCVELLSDRQGFRIFQDW